MCYHLQYKAITVFSDYLKMTLYAWTELQNSKKSEFFTHDHFEGEKNLNQDLSYFKTCMWPGSWNYINSLAKDNEVKDHWPWVRRPGLEVNIISHMTSGKQQCLWT